MEIVGAVASIGQCICGICGQCCSNESISEQRGYLNKRPQTLMKELEDKVNLLTAREADVTTKLHSEKMMRGLNPTAEVTLWLHTVQKMRATLPDLKEEIQEHKSFLCGCFPNAFYRVKLGNKVSKKIIEADMLLDQGNFGSLVSMPPEKGKILPTSILVGETARSILQRTREYLADADTGIIGFYGKGGVGKTAIVKEINNQLLRENIHFDDVIWVTATKEANLRKLQMDIANKIGLRFNEDEASEVTRAGELLQALLRRGRFLLIIDDLWEAFSLENIGIPTPTNVNGCKLLITTRLLRVCGGMETDKEIEVDVLAEEDAWDLFKQKVGEKFIDSSPRIQDVAKKVAHECGGLPLALITIGRALRKGNNIEHWQSALSGLRNSTARIEGMEDLVFKRLRFSYDRLKNDETRSCFLYCALYPEDHHIVPEELIKYWSWEGLLGIGGRLTKMADGWMILKELKDACMLESAYQDGQMGECVKMHDLIRDMAIRLTRANRSFMVKSGRGLRVQPAEEEWHPELERVSLMRNDLSSLNFGPQCPNLCTLLLEYNSFDKGIEPSFFNHMRNLKVLNLSYTGIHLVPESLSELENLHVLLLCSCYNLHHAPILSNLKKLRVLDFSYTPIEYFPDGMDMLLNLQHLNLSYTHVLEVPCYLFPRYKFLESLFVIRPGMFTSMMNSSPKILEECTSLAVLEVNFSNEWEFNQYTSSSHSEQLESFKFFIGIPPSSFHTGENSIVFFSDIAIFGSDYPLPLPVRTLELEFHACSRIIHLPKFETRGVSRVQRCKIRHCDSMVFIFFGGGSTFANLEWLEIEGLSELLRICREIIPAGIFTCLKVLHVSRCNKLTTLLPHELAKNLINLVEISIENCEKIAEVIEGVEGDEVAQVKFPDMVLPMLQKMKLNGLPQLKQLHNGSMICDSLSSVEVYRCPELKTLPFLVEMREQMLHSLKQIKGSKSWWRELRRNHRNAINLLNPIFKQVEERSSVPGPSSVQEDSDDGSPEINSGSSSFGPR